MPGSSSALASPVHRRSCTEEEAVGTPVAPAGPERPGSIVVPDGAGVASASAEGTEATGEAVDRYPTEEEGDGTGDGVRGGDVSPVSPAAPTEESKPAPAAVEPPSTPARFKLNIGMFGSSRSSGSSRALSAKKEPSANGVSSGGTGRPPSSGGPGAKFSTYARRAGNLLGEWTG